MGEPEKISQEERKVMLQTARFSEEVITQISNCLDKGQPYYAMVLMFDFLAKQDDPVPAAAAGKAQETYREFVEGVRVCQDSIDEMKAVSIERNEMFSPGHYFVGDLAAVTVGDSDFWQRIRDSIGDGNRCGLRRVDGIELAIIPTEVGDGIFYDDCQKDRMFGVDSGTVGCIPAADIGLVDVYEPEEFEGPKGLWHVIKFDEPFAVTREADGIRFGNKVSIVTC